MIVPHPKRMLGYNVFLTVQSHVLYSEFMTMCLCCTKFPLDSLFNNDWHTGYIGLKFPCSTIEVSNSASTFLLGGAGIETLVPSNFRLTDLGLA